MPDALALDHAPALALAEPAATGEPVAQLYTPLTLSRHRHGPLVAALAGVSPPAAVGRHFSVWRLADDVAIVHGFAAADIDNGIAGRVADELLPLLRASRDGAAAAAYRYSDQQLFEGCVGAIVRSVDASERRAWHLFYGNTLKALAAPGAPGGGGGDGGEPAVLGDFRAIHRRAAVLIAEAGAATVLDAATCFGFLPLALALGDAAAGRRRRIVGCDINPALVRLADDYRRHAGLADVAFVTADVLGNGAIAAPGHPSPRFDCVTALHLLEHLAPSDSARAIARLWALTRRRLIVAVPFEAVADERFGHRQVFDADRLARLARPLTGVARSFEDHGGWLVVDRPGRAGKPGMRP